MRSLKTTGLIVLNIAKIWLVGIPRGKIGLVLLKCFYCLKKGARFHDVLPQNL